MAADRPKEILRVPGERDIAFAVCIVHSTPPGLSVEEFIELLRRHVAKGRRDRALSSTHQHLDRSTFWHSEYERVKAALESANQEKLGLKMEVDRLKAKTETASSSNPTKKRKKQDDEDVVPVPRSPKRLKQASSERSAALTRANADAGFSFNHLGEPGDMLMRSFYGVHALLKRREKTDPVMLARHLVSAANTVSDVIERGTDQIWTQDGFNQDALDSLLRAVNRAQQSLLLGYNRITSVMGGAEVQGHVVYSYVKMLDKSITTIGEFANAEAAKVFDDDSVTAARPSMSKGKTKQVSDPTVDKRGKVIGSIVMFINSSIDMLDPKTDAHKPFMEGLAYALIEKLGMCLYTLVFGHPRNATIMEEIAASSKAGDIEAIDSTQQANPEEMAVSAAKLEAPYLVRLLTRLMHVAPAHFGSSGTARSGKSKGVSKTTSSKHDLAIMAKERLQRTLVNCMFGAGAETDKDPFLDCLQRPLPAGSLPAVSIDKGHDVQEWFKEEVWRLLGWDILSGEGGW